MKNEITECDNEQTANFRIRIADAEVQRFGLRCAIVFSFFTPLFLYSLIYLSALQHLDLKLSPDHALIVCLGNMASIIAFGFRGPSGVKK